MGAPLNAADKDSFDQQDCRSTSLGTHDRVGDGVQVVRDICKACVCYLHGKWNTCLREALAELRIHVHKKMNTPGNSGHHHDHTDPPSEVALRVRALESLLVEKGLVDPAAIDALIDTYENRIGPRNGAKVVARAWSDPTFKQWLLEDATAAIHRMGYSGRQGEHMKVVESTGCVEGIRYGTWRGHRNPSVGFDLGNAVPGSADAPPGHRGLERGGASRPRHP